MEKKEIERQRVIIQCCKVNSRTCSVRFKCPANMLCQALQMTFEEDRKAVREILDRANDSLRQLTLL
jgi:hypothetical protein